MNIFKRLLCGILALFNGAIFAYFVFALIRGFIWFGPAKLFEGINTGIDIIGIMLFFALLIVLPLATISLFEFAIYGDLDSLQP
jgi:hypothetical protein